MYVTYIVIKFHLLCDIFLRNHDNKTYADKKLSSDYSEDSDSSSTYRKYISLQSFAHDSMCICSCICTKRNCYQCNRIVTMSPPSYLVQNSLSVSVHIMIRTCIFIAVKSSVCRRNKKTLSSLRNFLQKNWIIYVQKKN